KELRLTLIEQLGWQQKYAEAAAQDEALDKNDPNNPDYLREWGKLLLKDTNRPAEGRREAAAEGCRARREARRQGQAAAGKRAARLMAGGVAHRSRWAKRTRGAIDLYKKAVELPPESPQYRESLGEYYHSLKRPDDALATGKEIAAGKNRNAKSLARLAEVLS